jgi:hypothetical protein
MNGGSDFEFRKLPGFREAVKPRPVAGDRSHEATFFTNSISGQFTQFLHAAFSCHWAFQFKKVAGNFKSRLPPFPS